MKYIILIILLLAACQGSNNGPPTDQDFMKGTAGIQFEFIPDRPSKQIYENDNSPIILNVHNYGAFDINSVERPVVFSVNTDPFYANFFPGTNSYVLEQEGKATIPRLTGKGQLYPLGEFGQYIIGNLRTSKLPGQVESPETEMTVNICYPYQTRLLTQICVNSDVYDTDDRQESCEVEPKITVEGQGAPVNVMRVDPQVLLVDEGIKNMPGPNGQQVPTRVQTVVPVFKINIRNTGGGIPYHPQRKDTKLIDFCTLNDVNSDIEANVVLVSAKLDPSNNNPNKLDCNGGLPGLDAFVKLRDGQADLFCQMPADNPFINAQYNYLASLQIQLDYVYSESKKFEFEVIRKPNFVDSGAGSINYDGEDTTQVINPDDFLDRAQDALEDEAKKQGENLIDDLKNKSGLP